MKKEWENKIVKINVFLVFLVLNMLLFSFVQCFYFFEEERNFEGELYTLGSYYDNIEEGNIIKKNCSDENLRKIWDFGFEESSNNIQIFSNKGDDVYCDNVFMYKINENLANIVFLNTTGDYIKKVQARFYKGNFSNDFLTEIQLIENPADFNYDLVDLIFSSSYRDVADSEHAKNIYDNTFSPDIDNLNLNSLDDYKYYFHQEEGLEYEFFAKIHIDYYLDILKYNETRNFTCVKNDNADIYTKGNLTLLDETYVDFCENNMTLREYNCDVENNSILVDCEAYCDNGRCYRENSAPVFLENECRGFIINKNDDLIKNLYECFDDPDDDNLSFSYRLSDENITVRLEDEIMEIIPKKDWEGRTFFWIYANDSLIEVKKSIEIFVKVSSNTSETIEDLLSYNKSSDEENKSGKKNDGDYENKDIFHPVSENLSFLDIETQNFSIKTDFQEIKWHLNNDLVSENKSYKISDLEKGDYNLSAEVIINGKTYNKTWFINIKESEGNEFYFGVGEVVFILIVVVIVILILFFIWLFIIEKNKDNSENSFGFGVKESIENLKI